MPSNFRMAHQNPAKPEMNWDNEDKTVTFKWFQKITEMNVYMAKEEDKWHLIYPTVSKPLAWMKQPRRSLRISGTWKRRQQKSSDSYWTSINKALGDIWFAKATWRPWTCWACTSTSYNIKEHRRIKLLFNSCKYFEVKSSAKPIIRLTSWSANAVGPCKNQIYG